MSKPVDDFTRRLCGRIPYDREFILIGKDKTIKFLPGNSNGCSVEGDSLCVTLTSKTALAIRSALRPKAGTYKIPSLDRLVFEIEKTEIKDSDGNVLEIVG